MAYEELIDRMSSHMGKADIADVLPDLHAGAAALNEAAQAITTLERERDALAEALRPFADEAERQKNVRYYRDGHVPVVDCRVPIGAFNRAAAALKSLGAPND